MKEILEYLKQHGEMLDTDIAEATGIALPALQLQLTELAAKGEIMLCYTTRYEGKQKFEGISCRISGFIPKVSPGRKAKSQLILS